MQKDYFIYIIFHVHHGSSVAVVLHNCRVSKEEMVSMAVEVQQLLSLFYFLFVCVKTHVKGHSR